MNARRSPLVLAAALLAGCAAVEHVLDIQPRSPLQSVVVLSQVGANADTATWLEIVFIYDVKVVEMLPKDARDWFEHRDALLNDLSRSIESVRVGMPPASAYTVPLAPHHARAVRVFGYAFYPGSDRARRVLDLTTYSCVLLRLEPEDVSRLPCT